MYAGRAAPRWHKTRASGQNALAHAKPTPLTLLPPQPDAWEVVTTEDDQPDVGVVSVVEGTPVDDAPPTARASPAVAPGIPVDAAGRRLTPDPPPAGRLLDFDSGWAASPAGEPPPLSGLRRTAAAGGAAAVAHLKALRKAAADNPSTSLWTMAVLAGAVAALAAALARALTAAEDGRRLALAALAAQQAVAGAGSAYGGVASCAGGLAAALGERGVRGAVVVARVV